MSYPHPPVSFIFVSPRVKENSYVDYAMHEGGVGVFKVSKHRFQMHYNRSTVTNGWNGIYSESLNESYERLIRIVYHRWEVFYELMKRVMKYVTRTLCVWCTGWFQKPSSFLKQKIGRYNRGIIFLSVQRCNMHFTAYIFLVISHITVYRGKGTWLFGRYIIYSTLNG